MVVVYNPKKKRISIKNPHIIGPAEELLLQYLINNHLYRYMIKNNLEELNFGYYTIYVSGNTVSSYVNKTKTSKPLDGHKHLRNIKIKAHTIIQYKNLYKIH